MTTSDDHRWLPLEADAVCSGVVVDIAGVSVRLVASDHRRGEAVAALFRHAVPASVPAACELRFVDEPSVVPDTRPDTALHDAEFWRPEPGRLVIRSGGLTAHVTRDELTVGGDAPSMGRAFRFVALLALTHLLAQHERYLLHGGAVVLDARAVLVLGGTGTGKSTLALAAVRLGVPVLTDDSVVVHRHDGRLEAAGIPRPISVPRDVLLEFVPGSRPVPEDVRQRVELPAGTLAVGGHPVAGFVVTGWGDRPAGVLAPMGGPDALRTVLGASPALTDPAIRPGLFSIAGTLARMPAWTLQHGSDSRTRLEQATRLLADVGDQLRAAAHPT